MNEPYYLRGIKHLWSLATVDLDIWADLILETLSFAYNSRTRNGGNGGNGDKVGTNLGSLNHHGSHFYVLNESDFGGIELVHPTILVFGPI